MRNVLHGISKRAALACLALVAMASAGFADNSKISPDLLPLLSNSTNQVNVIVQYTAPQCAGGLLGNLLCTTFDVLGGVIKTVFSVINAVAATLTAQDVISLSNQS